MVAKIYSIEDLFTDDTDLITSVYFDFQSYKQLASWTRQPISIITESAIIGATLASSTTKEEISNTNSNLLDTYLTRKRLPVRFFEGQIAFLSDNRKKKAIKALESVGMIYEDDEWREQDSLFTNEVENIYFHDEERDNARQHAKFLVLARQASAGERLRIITAHSSFKRVMDVDLYMLPNQVSEITLPANFDLFTDLDLHQRLRKAVSIPYMQKDYPTVVFEAAKELSQFLRDVSGSAEDGYTLLQDVMQYSKKTKIKPTVQLNTLSSDSEENEHQGYFDFFAGVVRAVRNPTAHTTATDPFITSRFNDLKKTTKLLCFMSLLFEKIEERTSPV